MKKILIGLTILSSLAFARFEKEYGFQEIKDTKEELVLESGSCNIIRFKNTRYSKTKFYDTIENILKGKEYKIKSMSDTVVWVDLGYGMIFYNNSEAKEVVCIVIDNYKDYKKAYEYLKANDLISSENNYYLASIGLTMVIDDM